MPTVTRTEKKSIFFIGGFVVSMRRKGRYDMRIIRAPIPRSSIDTAPEFDTAMIRVSAQIKNKNTDNAGNIFSNSIFCKGVFQP